MQTAPNRTRTRIVQSRQNSRVKELRSALSHGGRSRDGRVALEGVHLVEEAIRSGLPLETIFIREGDESLLDPLALNSDIEILVLPPELFASVVSTESPQGIAALASPASASVDALFQGTPLVVVAAGLQDPGNLGTLLRSSEAFGATGVIALPGTVSQWNAKALRASSGSAFRLPVISLDQDECFALLRRHGVRILAATISDGESLRNASLKQPIALLIGNEGSGLSESLLALADARITIPCPGPVESLNAAVAVSVLLYEASRQRASASDGVKKQRQVVR
jgi:RNA methyltransferase, TrmH family